MQRMMYDAAKYQLAMRGVRSNPAPVPPVQRPGVSRPRVNNTEDGRIRSLEERFNCTGDMKVAAQLLNARRAARG